jgi:aspartyl/asparaginyl beta-hydroxylase (cupin superfamily)
MFQDVTRFPYLSTIADQWRDICDEARAVLPQFQEWGERHLYDKGWEVFGLSVANRPVPDNRVRCPITSAAVDLVPGMVTAGFSLLRPGAHIKPHEGFSTPVYRCHLGLVIPDGCLFRVRADTRPWKEGEWLVFDDAHEHEAWNRSDSYRLVLLMDFLKPGVAVTAEERARMVAGFQAGLS